MRRSFQWILLCALIYGGTSVAEEQTASEASPKAPEDTVEKVDKVPAKTSPAPAVQSTAAVESVEAETVDADETEDGSEVESPEDAYLAKEVHSNSYFRMDLSGFMRAGYQQVFQDDQSPDFVGLNDGFYLESARLVVDIEGRRLSGRMSFDGGGRQFDAHNTAEGQTNVELLDAYFDFLLVKGLVFRAGQFRPAFDLEAARSRRDMYFTRRALYHRGVRNVEGYNIGGMGLVREQSAALRYVRDYGAIDVDFETSVSNGVSSLEPLNDNEAVAANGRFQIGFNDMLTVGTGARFNRATTGRSPDLIDQDELWLTADIQYVQRFGSYEFGLEFAATQRQIDVIDVDLEPTRTSRGYHASTRLGRGGFHLVYRFVEFDPTSEYSNPSDPQLASAYEADTLVEHTMGISFTPQQGPLTLQLNFTVADESVERAYANDRLDALVQMVF